MERASVLWVGESESESESESGSEEERKRERWLRLRHARGRVNKRFLGLDVGLQVTSPLPTQDLISKLSFSFAIVFQGTQLWNLEATNLSFNLSALSRWLFSFLTRTFQHISESRTSHTCLLKLVRWF